MFGVLSVRFLEKTGVDECFCSLVYSLRGGFEWV